MSQDFHQGIFSFSNELNRATAMHQNQHQQQQQHMAIGELPVYETGGMTMLSEMFSFQAGASPTADLLENQIKENYRLQQPPSNEWFGNRYGLVEGFRDTKQHHSGNNDDITIAQHHPMSGIHANSATAMQLFHMNPQPRSPSPTTPTSATPLHLLHPIPSTQSPSLQEFHPVRAPAAGFSSSTIPQTQFTWIASGGGGESTSTQLYSNNRNGRGVEGQGLSLSLSSLQHLEAVKAEEFRMGDSGMVYHNQGSSSSYQTKDLGNHHQHQPLPLQGMVVNQDHQVHVGYSSSFGVINLLRNSKYAKAAQDLLEEFCSVGRGQMKNIRLGKQKKNSNTKQSDGEPSSSLSKDLPPLSAAERIEYQRKKAALLSMLDEVDRRYNHYSEQMQMVVNSFDSVMGYGAATPYTVLAQKAMSRHFRCLKDAIVGKLKEMREIVGEKDGTGSSITKGETPKLKLIDQSLRQQRAFQQMGLMEQEAWRPQRGLPERSVTLLRAWLFEHFLHPYPSDADKHLLARQTGLSRNQVSNWFINARVRLWKPMVEEMYLQESKEEEEEDENGEERTSERSQQDQSNNSAQTPTPSATTTTTTPKPSTGKRSEINATENDHSSNAINTQCSSENQATTTKYNDMSPTKSQRHHQMAVDDRCQRGSTIQVDFGTTGADTDIESSLERFGISTGDVSLTLGLQHNGNLPENNRFSVSDFGSC